VAPKDGTAIAVVNNGVPLHQVLDDRGVHYDASKFNWLGSPGAENEVVFAWRSGGVRTVEDLKSKELILGGTGPASNIVIIPTAMNNLLGTRFKIVLGYKASNDVFLAMERGEVQARDGTYALLEATRPDWISDGKLVFLTQAGLTRDPNLPDVPLLTELARDGTERAVWRLISAGAALGQPYLAPPGLPPERVAELRRAFADTMRDAEFRAESLRLHVPRNPIGGEDLAKIIDETVHAPPDIVAKARAAMGQGAGGPGKS